MKGFMKWKIFIVTSLVCLLPILLGLALWNDLPDMLAVHFDINNNPDRFASKAFAVFGLPCLMVLLQAVCCVINDVNAKKFGERRKFELATKWLIPCMSILFQTITFIFALGRDIDIRKCVMVIVCAVLMVVGNYLPKLDYVKNYDIETEKARKINRFIGFETVVMAVLGFMTIFMPPVASVVWLFMLIPYAVISVIYSIIIVKKEK